MLALWAVHSTEHTPTLGQTISPSHKGGERYMAYFKCMIRQCVCNITALQYKCLCVKKKIQRSWHRDMHSDRDLLFFQDRTPLFATLFKWIFRSVFLFNGYILGLGAGVRSILKMSFGTHHFLWTKCVAHEMKECTAASGSHSRTVTLGHGR